MKKIKKVFVFNRDTNLVDPILTEGCEWLLTGKATPTVKFDGTTCLWKDNALWKRYDLKAGRTRPADFVPAQEAPDPVTGHFPGWRPISENDPADKWHFEGLKTAKSLVDNMTYELIGPKVQGNIYYLKQHYLILHGSNGYPLRFPQQDWSLIKPEPSVEKMYNKLRIFFSAIKALNPNNPVAPIEGIVWWMNGEPVGKLTRLDFGFDWPIDYAAWMSQALE